MSDTTSASPIRVFVSYSHDDLALVRPVVSLLRAMRGYVFQDIDGIRPGTQWAAKLDDELAASHLVVVFWCHHSLRSKYVKREYNAAIREKKDILPLLIDATPLPRPLRKYQWLDFRPTVGAAHSGPPAVITLPEFAVVVATLGVAMSIADNVQYFHGISEPDWTSGLIFLAFVLVFRLAVRLFRNWGSSNPACIDIRSPDETPLNGVLDPDPRAQVAIRLAQELERRRERFAGAIL